jgi:hypothetical protein
MGTERKFLPDTSEEKAVVKELKRAGYRVTLFLAGRNILQDIPDRFRYNRRLFGSGEDHMLSGPVTVGHDDLKGLPDARALWEPAREALRQFDKGESRYAFTENGWLIDARPVKAFAEECVKCHGHTSIQVTPDRHDYYYSIWRRQRSARRRPGWCHALRLQKKEVNDYSKCPIKSSPVSGAPKNLKT